MDVVVSRLAKWMIKRRGGELWVWGAPVGDRTLLIRTSTSLRDRGARFEYVEADGVRLWFERELPIYDVRIGWTPVTGFDVAWPGIVIAGGGG